MIKLKFKNLKKIKGDASYRYFFIKKKFKKKTIIIYSKKEKLKNLLIYDAINKLLNKNNILAPSLISENYKNNYIEVTDFGDNTVFKILKLKKTNIFSTYKKIIILLNKIQKIKDKQTLNFKRKKYILPVYDKKILFEETKIFLDWYLKKKIKKKNLSKFKKSFNNEVYNLISKICYKNNTFVHRDFHVSNLMIKKKKFALIDNQDALIGNKAYDLASLIDDVRIETSFDLKNKVLDFYLKTNKNIDKKKLNNDFKILSILRNLKIIGIFTRLSVRDRKNKYLRLIPYAWSLIYLRMKQDKIFNNLKTLLNKIN